MHWSTFEKDVRAIASLSWGCEARAETVAGVNLDCVLKVRPDYWVIVEITKENSLVKLRTDLAKLSTVRLALFQKNIYAQCFFVTEKQPFPSLPRTGGELCVEVLSAKAFTERFFDYPRYHFARSSRRFGSAVDTVTGDPDRREYVPIRFNFRDDSGALTLGDLGLLIKQNKRVILLGNYGTGKSRCIQQLFATVFSPQADNNPPALAIDLRDNWGVKRASEVVRRHFDDLGVSELGDAAIKLSRTEKLHLLLDGFDEIGSQSWSKDPKALREIRRDALQGIRSLISESRSGVLIAGRSHYFNSDDEMFSCLGLNRDTTIIIECADEFTPEEMEKYLQRLSGSVKLPEWLPRRPLICQIVGSWSQEQLEYLLGIEVDELNFWRTVLDIICKRECQINTSLDPDTVRAVLIRLATLVRGKPYDVGPITISDLDRVFEEIVGESAVEATSTMLQRLASLGRVSVESTDRQFIDPYILDGLRAEDVIAFFENPIEAMRTDLWRHPLKSFGLRLVGQHMINAGGSHRVMKIIGHSTKYSNPVLTADLVAAWLLKATGTVDFGGVTITLAECAYLSFDSLIVKGLSMESCVVKVLSVAGAVTENVEVLNCEIGKLEGVAADRRIPGFLKSCEIGAIDALDTVARIKSAELTEPQRILITIIKKTFFQPGGGREEQALLRGFGRLASPKVPEKILNLLLREGVLTRFKGAEGWVYKPVRALTPRMHTMLASLTVSDDPIWKGMSDL